MEQVDIKKLLKDNFNSVNLTKDDLCYRAAVYLNDGTYLPCVIFKESNKELNFIIERLKESKLFDSEKYNHNMSYKDYIHTFIKSGNKISLRDVSKIEYSPYAIPKNFYDKIYNAGETGMSWCQFTVIMNDGNEFTFGTSYELLFFDMPEGYNGWDIIEIHPHKSIDEHYYKPRNYFTCYID